MKTTLPILMVLLAAICFCGCSSNADKKPPIDLESQKKKPDISIHYEEVGGVKTIPVKINGVTIDMIYDTGCSGISMSLLEVQTLYKNGKFTENDIVGSSMSQIANGDIVENLVIKLREVRIGDENPIVLNDVDASVSPNQQAPILLGNTVLDEVATVEVDNVNKTINFYKH